MVSVEIFAYLKSSGGPSIISDKEGLEKLSHWTYNIGLSLGLAADSPCNLSKDSFSNDVSGSSPMCMLGVKFSDDGLGDRF
ncbi:hypothetical protein VNO77_07415 [Canavalia gladiata]|uniref:Uncharacterized protein n=1 Tax=Canavalia gladiata TaxID=3824 RepID=A0AAN9MDA3_CANGL